MNLRSFAFVGTLIGLAIVVVIGMVYLLDGMKLPFPYDTIEVVDQHKGYEGWPIIPIIIIGVIVGGIAMSRWRFNREHREIKTVEFPPNALSHSRRGQFQPRAEIFARSAGDYDETS